MMVFKDIDLKKFGAEDPVEDRKLARDGKG